MKKIKEIDIDGERVFLKKNDILGWAVVHPSKIDGKINWKNLLIGGNWIRFFFVIALVILLLLAIQEYASTVKIASDCLNQSQSIMIINPYG